MKEEKVRINLLLEKAVVQEAKQEGLNISRTVNSLLKLYLERLKREKKEVVKQL